jgi:hypothetical protein
MDYRIVKTSPRLSQVALALVAGYLLLADSCMWALRPADPETGRPSACYTFLELALGLKEPSLLRYVEFLAACVMLLGTPVLWVRSKARARMAALARKAARPGIGP